ncbi:DUF4278 domain-containing protein [Thermocoleostomius sinensis]|uniref:DUF4278 domain-containing protein n=1 Tax=Thermocoleostomius sinensis A174 TaxID=2016057 RepID=A0A9E9C5L6_9CYAN|nr:DUF4278 domain-containing protein [Thermocoleostomius sinensis]WAL58309.1 DUF4278 domain-containing protein [Thermocoleostomius sinensis A174]
MRLSYRGAHYQHQPTPVDLIDSGVSAQYRGQHYTVAYPRHIPVPQPTANLKYRGATYQTTKAGRVYPVSATVHPEMAATDRAVAIPLPLKTQLRQRQTNEVARVHLETIRQRLHHRIEVAKAKGDSTLLHELEKELHLFA